MSTKLGSLIAMIGAGMGGYAKGTQQRLENERQQKADGRAEDEYNYQQGERAKTQKLEGDIGAAMANRDVETVTTPDMSNADVSLAAPQPTQYKVGDQSYADEGAARAALLGTNSQAARYQRAAQVAAAAGSMAGIEQSMKFDALAKKAKAEGADQMLTHIQKAQPTLGDLKKAGGTMAGSITPEAAEVFNTTGSEWKLGPDAQVVHYIDKDSAGREFVNSRVLDKDGKPLLNDVHHAGLFLQDFKTRMEAQDNDTKTYQSALQITQGDKRITEDGRHHLITEAETKRDNAAKNAIERQKLEVAKAKAESVDVTHGIKGLSAAQNDALFGANGAVTMGRLDPNKINSKTATIFADAEIKNPGTNFAQTSSDINRGRRGDVEFATGKAGTSIRSFNVGISHLDTLGQLADALGNKDTQAINRIGNYFATQTGNPAPTNFQGAKKIVGDEIVKAIVGAGGGVADREEAGRVINAANSPAQLKGAIKTLQELMVGQLGGLEQQYRTTTNRDDFDKKLSPRAVQIRGSHSGTGGPGGASSGNHPSDINDLLKKYGGK